MNKMLLYTCLLCLCLTGVVLMNSTQAAKFNKKKAATAAVLAAAKAVQESKDNPVDSSKLASIEVSGVDKELKKNIELHMPVTIPECNADRADVKQFFTTVKKYLRRATRALGYYDAEFRSGGSIVNGCWKLRLRISPGKPVKVVSQHYQVVGEGKNEALFREALKDTPYQIGDPLNHQKYSDFKTKFSEAAQILGYFDAEFTQHAITISPASFQARIDLVLNTGTRYRYGEVTVDQNILSDKKIKNYILLKPGQPFNAEDLLKQQQFLQRSGYYKLIKIDALHQQAKNQRIPVHILLTPKKRNEYTFKLGYGSDTGARIAAEMDRRWTGSSGKKLKIKTQYSEILSGISAQLISPRKNPEDDHLTYDFKWQQDSNNDVISRSIELGANYTRKRSNDWIQSASIGLLLDTTKVERELSNNSTLLLFGVGLEKTKADNLLYAMDGWHLKLELKGAHQALLSDQSLLQFKASGKRIKKLSKGRVVARASIGTTVVDNFDDLPKSLRFFAGGSNSVRGYGFETLGDLNKDGAVIGGQQLVTSSLEYQYPVTDEWSAALFVDAGNAFDQWNDPNLKVGLGFGAHWRSPVGPVRIDIGFPKDDFSSPHLHLSVGTDL